MVYRYLKFLIWNDCILHLLTLIIYPVLFMFRKSIRKYKENKIIHLLWYFLNDGGDYGDKFFQEKEYKGNKWYQRFILSYKWAAWRNPMRNFYFSKPIKGQQIPLRYNVTCHRDNGYIGSWRTTKYKNEFDVFKDKHGDYIDYSTSILGKQWYVFTMNGVTYFRKSMATAFYSPLFNKIINIEYKFGFENFNYATQFHIKFLKVNRKSIGEFNEYKIVKREMFE